MLTSYSFSIITNDRRFLVIVKKNVLVRERLFFWGGKETLSALAKNTFAGEDTCITGILTGKSIECKSSDNFMSWNQPDTFSDGLQEETKSLRS